MEIWLLKLYMVISFLKKLLVANSGVLRVDLASNNFIGCQMWV